MKIVPNSIVIFPSGLELLKRLKATKEHAVERITGTRKEEVTVSAVLLNTRACQR